jgi:hypothetical protein
VLESSVLDRDRGSLVHGPSCLDLLVVAGLAAAALGITDLRLDAGTVPAALMSLALADVTVRLTVLSRREA